MSKRTSDHASRNSNQASRASSQPESASRKTSRASSKINPARLAALCVTRSARERNAFINELLSSYLATTPLSSADKAFATKLARGVASTWGTLDEVINRNLRSPSDIEDDVRDALRISTYEIIYLDKSEHAAVDQGVELVRQVTPKAAGLANAVLRKVVGSKKNFPFGDPKQDRKALARLFAFPYWLTSKLIDDLGQENAVLFMRATNEDAPLFIAVNALKATDEEIKVLFESISAPLETVSAGDSAVEGCFRLREGRALQNEKVKQLFAEGKILVSDAASQIVADLTLFDKQPQSFLEIGSGRGTKTILIQSNAKRKYGHQIKLSSLDYHAFKADILAKRAKVYGTSIDQIYSQDATKLHEVFTDELFDTIFIDAPCSGLGTLRRHPEIRWRLKEENILTLAQLGSKMLESAAPYVAVGGSIVYSTCTVTRIENEEVIQGFLTSKQGVGFRLEPLKGRKYFSSRLSPGSSDAHFAVRLVRVV